MTRAQRFAIAAGVAFLVEALLLGRLEPWDAACAALFAPDRPAWLVAHAKAISSAAPWLAAAFALGAGAFAWRRGAHATLRRATVVSVSGLVLAAVLKWVLDRERPSMGVWASDMASFPSGDVANAALLSGAAMQLLAASVPRRWRRSSLVAGSSVALAFVGTVAWARLYLGRHWLTDVVGAMLLAVALLATGEWLGRPVRTRARAATHGAMALAGLGMVAIAGLRVTLPAPSWATESTTPPPRVKARRKGDLAKRRNRHPNGSAVGCDADGRPTPSERDGMSEGSSGEGV